MPKKITQLSPLGVECIKGALQTALKAYPESPAVKAAIAEMDRSYPNDWHLCVTRSRLIAMGGIEVRGAIKFYAVTGIGQRVLVYKSDSGKWILPSGKEVPRDLAPRTLKGVSILLEQCGVTGA